MRRFLTIAAAALSAVLLTAVPARTQTASPEAIAAARELVTAARAVDQFKMLMPLISQQLKPAIVQGRKAVERDYDQVMPIVIEAAGAQSEKFAEAIAIIYANNFTTGEIREVTAFYRSPTGQKFLEKMPVIAQQSMAMGQKFGEQLMQDLQAKITDELRKRGHKI